MQKMILSAVRPVAVVPVTTQAVIASSFQGAVVAEVNSGDSLSSDHLPVSGS